MNCSTSPQVFTASETPFEIRRWGSLNSHPHTLQARPWLPQDPPCAPVPGWPMPGWPMPGWPMPGWPMPGWPLPGWPTRACMMMGMWCRQGSYQQTRCTFRWPMRRGLSLGLQTLSPRDAGRLLGVAGKGDELLHRHKRVREETGGYPPRESDHGGGKDRSPFDIWRLFDIRSCRMR